MGWWTACLCIEERVVIQDSLDQTIRRLFLGGAKLLQDEPRRVYGGIHLDGTLLRAMSQEECEKFRLQYAPYCLSDAIRRKR